jgi:hypothetical protein
MKMVVFWVVAPWHGLLNSLMIEAGTYLKRRTTSTRLHGATTQKTAIFKLRPDERYLKKCDTFWRPSARTVVRSEANRSRTNRPGFQQGNIFRFGSMPFEQVCDTLGTRSHLSESDEWRKEVKEGGTSIGTVALQTEVLLVFLSHSVHCSYITLKSRFLCSIFQISTLTTYRFCSW